MAEKVAYSDPTAQILQFFQGLGGTKTNSSSTTSMDPKFLEPLLQLAAVQGGQITPEGAAQMLQEVFRIGGKGAPGLATQFANSAGARTSRNSGLNLANANLQTELAGKATQLLAGLQRDYGQTGASLANAAPKTTSQSQTQKPGNMALSLAPFLLGNLGSLGKVVKGAKDVAGDLFSSGDTGFGSVTGGSGGFGTTVNNPSAFAADSLGFTPDTSAISNASSFDFGDALGGVDFGAAADVSNWVPDTGFASVADSFDFGDALGGFFANGGKIRMRSAPGYADGGSIEFVPGAKRKSKLDEAEDAALGTTATPSTPTTSTPTLPKAKSTAARIGDLLRGRFADGGRITGYSDPTGLLPETTAAIDVTSLVPSTSANFSAGGANSAGASGTPDFSNEKIGDDVVQYFAGLDASASNSGYDDPARGVYSGKDGYTYIAADNGIQQLNSKSKFDDSDDGKWRAGKFDKIFNYEDGSFNDVSAIAPKAPGSGFGAWLMSAVSLATGNPATAFARTIGGKAAMGALEGMFNNDMQSHIFGGVTKTNNRPNSTRSANFTGAGYKEGGSIKGPGSGTSDSIPIMASRGEFMMSADVVETLGEDFFQGLQELFHTPVPKKV